MQAEDRVRRIGQTKNVESYWISGFEFDDKLDKLLQTKNNKSNIVINDKGILINSLY